MEEKKVNRRKTWLFYININLKKKGKGKKLRQKLFYIPKQEVRFCLQVSFQELAWEPAPSPVQMVGTLGHSEATQGHFLWSSHVPTGLSLCDHDAATWQSGPPRTLRRYGLPLAGIEDRESWGTSSCCTKCEKRGLPLPVLLGVGWEVPAGPGMGEKAKHVLGVIPELLLQREQCCLQVKEGSGRSLQVSTQRKERDKWARAPVIHTSHSLGVKEKEANVTRSRADGQDTY